VAILFDIKCCGESKWQPNARISLKRCPGNPLLNVKH
jgi:hypothetical protein